MQNKQRNEERQYEVIVAPTDVFEKKLEEILGGATEGAVSRCTCKTGSCYAGTGNKGKECAPGYEWDEIAQDCLPVPLE